MAHREYSEQNATQGDRRQRRRRHSDERRHEPAEDSTTESTPRRKLRPKAQGSGRLQLGLLAILLGTLIWFAPAIISNTILRQWVLNRVARDLHGSVTCDSAKLGWFTPVEANDVELRDADGKTIVRATSCVGDNTLLTLLLNPHSPGHFRIAGAQADLVLRDDGSNLEDVLAAWLQPSETPRAKLALSVEIVDAHINLHDTASRRAWLIEPLNCTVKLHTESPDAISFEMRGAMPAGNAPASSWEAQATLLDGEPLPTLRDAKIKAEAFPLAACQALVRRLRPGTELAGLLTADLVYQSPNNPSAPAGVDPSDMKQKITDKFATSVAPNLQGQIALDQVAVAGPWLGTDKFQMQHVSLPCRLHWQGDRLNVEQLDVTCDLGKFTCQGSIDDARTLLNDLQPARMLAAVNNAAGTVTGQLDLARLAQLLPDTLKVRNGTQITSGSVNFNIQAGGSAAGRTWQGHLETSRLTALNQGQQISWDKPLSIDLAAHTTEQGPVVDRLKCESDFLDVTGSGTPNDLHIVSTYDLTRLAAQLGQFVDLEGMRLAGAGTINLNWKLAPNGGFTADTQLQVNNFELTRPGAIPWIEQQLTVAANATGLLAANSTNKSLPQRVDTATLTVRSADDSLSATLNQPAVDLTLLSPWPLELKLKGRIARWRARIEPWFGWPAGWDVDGEADASATTNCSLMFVEIKQSQATIAPLHLWGNGWFIDEPSVRMNGSGRWATAERRLDIAAATIAAPALAAQVSNAALTMTQAAALQLAGRVDFQGELAALQAWTHDPRIASTCRFAGRLQGSAQVDQSAASTAAQASATIDNLQATPLQGQPWQEPQIKLTGKGNYDRANDTLKLEQLQLVSEAVRGDIAGEIARMMSTRDMKLAGHVDFDWERINRWLQPYVGTRVQLAGHESRQFSVAGPLASVAGVPAGNAPAATFGWCQQLSGKADFGWQSANLYGLPFGPTTLKAELSGGVLRIDPFDFVVSNGHLRLSPQVRLTPDPAEISAAPGVILDHIQLTPAMCQQGLKYVVPVLAEVTQTDGMISMNLEGCRLPLANPSAGDAAGTVTIHSVEVGPGPLMQELTQLLGQLPKAQLAKESTIQYRLVDGRIYHKGLQLDFPAFTIRTYGSVGLDDSLAMMVEMPLPTKWLPNNALRDTLQTRSINLPLIGTLSHPRLDPQAVQQAASQFLERATEGLFKGQINQKLDKIFNPANPILPR